MRLAALVRPIRLLEEPVMKIPCWPFPSPAVRAVVTGSGIVGRFAVGAIVFGPDPIEKRIVSAPTAALAARIASRSVQFAASHEPSSVSPAELTVKVAARRGEATTADRNRA